MDMTKDPTAHLDQSGDKELRSRVRLFGNLLGEVLREHAGEDILAAVESLRKGYIKLRREENPRLRDRLTRSISNLDPDALTHVIRAFNLYFSLVNSAASRHAATACPGSVPSSAPCRTFVTAVSLPMICRCY